MSRTTTITRTSLFVLALVACTEKKDPTPAPVDAGVPVLSTMVDAAPAPTPTPTVAATMPEAGVFEPASVSAGEADHVFAPRPDYVVPDAIGATAAVKKHFTIAPHGFEVQRTPMTAKGRTATLAFLKGMDAPAEWNPFIVVSDEKGAVVWQRDNPVGGIKPPIGPMAIAPAAHGRLALAVCDPPTGVVALRLFDDDGAPFADFQAMQIESCDALALMYWPKRGWILVAARAGVTKARLIKESGSPGWANPVDVGVRSPADAVSVPSLAGDTDDSFVLVQVAQPTATPGSPFHALAFRYDAEGTAIWKQATDLGETQPGRAVVTSRSPGVHVKLANKELDVKPSGATQ